MPDPSVKLFLSCVSDEFGDYRDALRRALTRPNVEVKIQEDFKALGGDTLKMLEEYIALSDAVVHFAGDLAGSAPPPGSVDDLCKRRPELETRLADKGLGREALKSLTYTQWEAWLAIGFDKDLLIVAPAPGAAPTRSFVAADAARASQAEHLKRLRAIDRFPGKPFTSLDNLVAQVFGTAVIDALVRAGNPPLARKPRNLPLPSLGDLFAGREKTLADLSAALANATGAAVVGRALHGLGGIGKTRLAIEYAWTRESDYSALLFVRADDAAALGANLAALAGAQVLDLKEAAQEDEARIEAVLRWLESNPTWLLILDNVDDEHAVKAVMNLMPRLKGGHVIVTARAGNFPASVRKLELDALDEDAAMQFLLKRTSGDRAEAHDDEAQARVLARELGGLALGLEQAGAHIATDRIGFRRYLKLWIENREQALHWSDPTLTGTEKTLATTWATSVAPLKPDSRRLLDRLAMLASDPIPDALLDIAIGGEAADHDGQAARAGLFAYSLVSRAKSEDGAPGIVIHRLVQDFARRAMSEERRVEALREALAWVDAAFAGDPENVRTWPVLDPLAPHALAIALRADEAQIVEPTGRLLDRRATLSYAKARYAEAEPLYRRALAIAEAAFEPDHPTVAVRLNNLANLLQNTNRRGEAEPLCRRALAIEEAALGPDHPNVAVRLNTLANLFQNTNRNRDAEPLFRRALAISEKSYGPYHPQVANGLYNLANLFRQTSRTAEAEPLVRRSIAVNGTILGRDHPNVAAGLNLLALLLMERNRFGEAETLLRRALEIDETAYGPDHPKVANALTNLAEVLRETQRPDEAERLHRRALAIDEVSYGPVHPKVAVRLNNLAALLEDMNRSAEAEPLCRRALAIDESSHGPDHPNVATRLNNLARVLQSTGRTAEAKSLYRRALSTLEKSYGPDHWQVAACLGNLAGLLIGSNRPAKAEPLLRRARKIFEAKLGADHPYALGVRMKLAALRSARKPKGARRRTSG